jgi:hypothetical protein
MVWTRPGERNGSLDGTGIPDGSEAGRAGYSEAAQLERRTRNVWSAAELQGQREEIVGIRRQMSAAWLYLGGSIRPAGSASLFTVHSAISASF